MKRTFEVHVDLTSGQQVTKRSRKSQNDCCIQPEVISMDLDDYGSVLLPGTMHHSAGDEITLQDPGSGIYNTTATTTDGYNANCSHPKVVKVAVQGLRNQIAAFISRDRNGPIREQYLR